MIDYAKLKGRLLMVYHDGWRVGRIVSVQAGKRVGLRKLRLASSSYEGTRAGSDRFAWHGPKYSVDGRAVKMPGAGVVYRRKVVPVEDFLRGQS